MIWARQRCKVYWSVVSSYQLGRTRWGIGKLQGGGKSFSRIPEWSLKVSVTVQFIQLAATLLKQPHYVTMYLRWPHHILVKPDHIDMFLFLRKSRWDVQLKSTCFQLVVLVVLLIIIAIAIAIIIRLLNPIAYWAIANQSAQIITGRYI